MKIYMKLLPTLFIVAGYNNIAVCEENNWNSDDKWVQVDKIQLVNEQNADAIYDKYLNIKAILENVYTSYLDFAEIILPKIQEEMNDKGLPKLTFNEDLDTLRYIAETIENNFVYKNNLDFKDYKNNILDLIDMYNASLNNIVNEIKRYIGKTVELDNFMKNFNKTVIKPLDKAMAKIK